MAVLSHGDGGLWSNLWALCNKVCSSSKSIFFCPRTRNFDHPVSPENLCHSYSHQKCRPVVLDVVEGSVRPEWGPCNLPHLFFYVLFAVFDSVPFKGLRFLFFHCLLAGGQKLVAYITVRHSGNRVTKWSWICIFLKHCTSFAYSEIKVLTSYHHDVVPSPVNLWSAQHNLFTEQYNVLNSVSWG